VSSQKSSLLALSEHTELHCTCPLSGAKRTYLGHRRMSANDPKRMRSKMTQRHASRGKAVRLFFRDFGEDRISVGINPHGPNFRPR
jgi:hypothetical protein